MIKNSIVCERKEDISNSIINLFEKELDETLKKDNLKYMNIVVYNFPITKENEDPLISISVYNLSCIRPGGNSHYILIIRTNFTGIYLEYTNEIDKSVILSSLTNYILNITKDMQNTSMTKVTLFEELKPDTEPKKSSVPVLINLTSALADMDHDDRCVETYLELNNENIEKILLIISDINMHSKVLNNIEGFDIKDLVASDISISIEASLSGNENDPESVYRKISLGNSILNGDIFYYISVYHDREESELALSYNFSLQDTIKYANAIYQTLNQIYEYFTKVTSYPPMVTINFSEDNILNKDEFYKMIKSYI